LRNALHSHLSVIFGWTLKHFSAIFLNQKSTVKDSFQPEASFGRERDKDRGQTERERERERDVRQQALQLDKEK